MSKYLDTYMIKEVFESAGFKVTNAVNEFVDYQIETEIKDTYTEIDIININERFAELHVPDKPYAPYYGVNPKQFWMDLDEEILKKSYSNVYRNNSSITILRADCELDILYSEKGVICDFQCHKFHPVELSSMGSLIGSGYNNKYNEPICARIEKYYDDDAFTDGLNL